MSYYYSRIVDDDFEAATQRVTEALSAHGFGVLTEIDVSATMKKKLGKDMAPYRILGACNPEMAYKALQAESKIGTMLPCNVILEQLPDGRVEVAAIDPVASMQAVNNPGLLGVATHVRELLKQSIDALG